MIRNPCPDLLASVVAHHKIPEDIASHIRLYRDEEEGLDGERNMTLTMIERRTKGNVTRENEVTIVYTHPQRMEEILSSKAEIATFIDLGVRAIKPSQRPELPEWVKEASSAPQKRQQMKKASTLANKALAEGRKSMANSQRAANDDYQANVPF